MNNNLINIEAKNKLLMSKQLLTDIIPFFIRTIENNFFFWEESMIINDEVKRKKKITCRNEKYMFLSFMFT